MKQILMFTILLCSSYVNAQVKHDNTIIAHNANFDSAVMRLMDLGYKIEKIDKDFKTAQTDVGKHDVRIYIRERGNDLYITGDIVSMNLILPVVYGDGSKKRWETLMEYAGGFQNIDYWKNPKQ